ncbi:MAG: hypothetical protein PSX79_02620 [bacterium]|nr:hypothetical protein [bacterium]
MARNLSGKLVAPAADVTALADKAWFEAHIARDFLLRDPAPLEFKDPLGDAGDGFSWRVLVVRLDGGSRLRLPLSLAWDLHNDHAKDQHLAVLFEQVAPDQAKALRAQALAKLARA